MKLGWTLTLAACLAGCGTAPRATAVAPDAQLAHADGLLSGYAGQVHSHDGVLTLRTTDYGALTRTIAPAARRAGASLLELRPADESLESVFSYLVRR